MTLNYKYTILYTFVSLSLFWIVIKYGSFVCYGSKDPHSMREEFTNSEQKHMTNVVSPNDATGKLGQQGLTYSSLTTGYNNQNVNFAEIYPGSKDAQIKKAYKGDDSWTVVFNKGLELYNKKRTVSEKYNEGISQAIKDEDYFPEHYGTKYPMTLSATGEFYQTTPPASNSNYVSLS